MCQLGDHVSKTGLRVEVRVRVGGGVDDHRPVAKRLHLEAHRPKQPAELFDRCARDGYVGGEVASEEDKSPEFVIRAPVSTWRRVIEKKLDPIQGMITGQLKLNGTMSKIMRFPKAASELVNCATKVPTDFPS